LRESKYRVVASTRNIMMLSLHLTHSGTASQCSSVCTTGLGVAKGHGAGRSPLRAKMDKPGQG